MLPMDTECPVARQWSPTPVGVFFDPLVDPLSFNNVRFAAVIVTHDVVDGSRGVLLVLVFCLYGVLSSNGEC